MLTQTQLKAVFHKYDFSPLKRFGENYLIDGNVKDKIIAEAFAGDGDTILEIGPGFGALTIDLASSGAAVFAVEKDKKAFEILKDLVGDGLPKLKIFNEDILDFDIKSIFTGRKIKVVGNLPYYITTPVIEYLIENREIVESALILMQKEVADRLLAPEGSKERGSISCFVQYYTKPEYLSTINRHSFHPVPGVDSALLRLKVLDKPAYHVKDEQIFFKIVRGAFNQRRKSIINSLSRESVLNIPKDELMSILKKLNIDPTSRPQVLSLSSFASIANSVS
ncbi:MAG: 16S rRNA (adenine(1518)-N(6)/adenine(1519)-N(6))-dimethyltransferase RsmA [Candidatus Omnitrophota bacterium]|nr:16S rRNA (adenine(1518)-N(6)/adenine(1519)-N(6))-dimethyltransferase RsmA [Candidatus Omnitrophota bacterium]